MSMEPVSKRWHSLVAGGVAGFSVDVSLFPLDTIKTRLQSAQGFYAAGGLRGIYRGITPVLLGSVPNGAVFFVTYDTTKGLLGRHGLADVVSDAGVHLLSASLGEITACSVRVPVEVLKQRQQVGHHPNLATAFRHALRTEGIRGFYRGYTSTIAREIPFSAIQFPLWEAMKAAVARRNLRKEPTAVEAGICGAIAGGFSAAVTTPLDVAKTRIMLAAKAHEADLASGNIGVALRVVHAEKGWSGLFAGVTPRVTWISIGGAIFLGIYEKVKQYLDHNV